MRSEDGRAWLGEMCCHTIMVASLRIGVELMKEKRAAIVGGCYCCRGFKNSGRDNMSRQRLSRSKGETVLVKTVNNDWKAAVS